MKSIIMAGGQGTRISNIFPEIPKPLIPISNREETRPVLEWEIKSLVYQGFRDILITVSHMADKIVDYFGDGSRLGANISYYIEEKPLGNAGALFKISDWLGDDDFLLLNADSVFDIDFSRFVKFHRDKGGLVTILTHPNNHPYDSGLIIAGSDSEVIKWLTKEEPRPEWYKNRVNAGLHIISPTILKMSGIKADEIGPNNKVDLDRMLLKPLCGTGKMFCYDSSEYVKDMGTPERYKQVKGDFESGIVSARNLMRMQKAIFLDRDGTINRYVGFLRNIEELELLSGTADAIKKINLSGYLAIVVTNQPVIARGEVKEEELQLIHNKLETLLGKEGAYLNAIYYCPHHPDKGYEGEIPELKMVCNCRKPKPGMLMRAVLDFNIDLKSSWMIGDGENDVKAGKAAGCRTVLIGEDDYGQDVTASSLLDAVNRIEAKIHGTENT